MKRETVRVDAKVAKERHQANMHDDKEKKKKADTIRGIGDAECADAVEKRDIKCIEGKDQRSITINGISTII